MMTNKTKIAKTVEEYLNSTDYSPKPHYVPSQFAIHFLQFIKLCHDGVLENKSPLIHLEVADKFDTDDSRILNLMHRGIAKTSLARYLFFYIAVYGGLPKFGKVGLALYVSDSIENGVKNMRKNLEYIWENSKFLKYNLPHARFTDIRWEFKNRSSDLFIIKGFGAKTGVRGVTEKNQRPKLAILDDLLSDEDARSATVISAINDTVHKAIKYAMHPTKYKIIWNGTPFNAGDPLYETAESGSWAVNVYPICEKFPCSKEEFRGSWEDRFTYEYVQGEYLDALANGKVDAFNQELMLRIMSDDDRLVLNSDLRWYSASSFRHLIANCNKYITTDFATSEKQSADFSVINVWGLNSNNEWFWLDGICLRQTMDKNVEDLFRLCSIYKPLSVGIEVSGQQQGFISWLKKEMMHRNHYFTLASSGNGNQEGIRPTTNKMERFNAILPQFKLGKFYFPEYKKHSDQALIELLHELNLASAGGFKSKKDDQIDTISQLALIKAYPPSTPMPRSTMQRGVFSYSNGVDSDNSSYFV